MPSGFENLDSLGFPLAGRKIRAGGIKGWAVLTPGYVGLGQRDQKFVAIGKAHVFMLSLVLKHLYGIPQEHEKISIWEAKPGKLHGDDPPTSEELLLKKKDILEGDMVIVKAGLQGMDFGLLEDRELLLKDIVGWISEARKRLPKYDPVSCLEECVINTGIYLRTNRQLGSYPALQKDLIYEYEKALAQMRGFRALLTGNVDGLMIEAHKKFMKIGLNESPSMPFISQAENRMERLRWIQTYLGVPVTDRYGLRTYRAVRNLQEKLNIPKTGLWDDVTQAAVEGDEGLVQPFPSFEGIPTVHAEQGKTPPGSETFPLYIGSPYNWWLDGCEVVADEGATVEGLAELLTYGEQVVTVDIIKYDGDPYSKVPAGTRIPLPSKILEEMDKMKQYLAAWQEIARWSFSTAYFCEEEVAVETLDELLAWLNMGGGVVSVTGGAVKHFPHLAEISAKFARPISIAGNVAGPAGVFINGTTLYRAIKQGDLERAIQSGTGVGLGSTSVLLSFFGKKVATRMAGFWVGVILLIGDAGAYAIEKGYEIHSKRETRKVDESICPFYKAKLDEAKLKAAMVEVHATRVIGMLNRFRFLDLGKPCN